VLAYPNPSNFVFNLEISTSSEENIEIRVYDMLGRQIETRSILLYKVSFSYIGANYPTAVYNIVITQGEDIKMIKVIKR